MLDPEGELLDALRAGDAHTFRQALSQMTVLEGRLKDMLADLLDATPALRSEFRKRLGFRGWPAPKVKASNCDAAQTDHFFTALRSGDDATLASALRTIDGVKGEHLEAFRRLVHGVPKLKGEYKKQLDLVGWSAGRPAADAAFKRTRQDNFCRMIEKRLNRGEKLEAVVTGMRGATGLRRSALMKLWGDWKRRKQQ
jgi:hypothetical protein